MRWHPKPIDGSRWRRRPGSQERGDGALLARPGRRSPRLRREPTRLEAAADLTESEADWWLDRCFGPHGLLDERRSPRTSASVARHDHHGHHESALCDQGAQTFQKNCPSSPRFQIGFLKPPCHVPGLRIAQTPWVRPLAWLAHRTFDDHSNPEQGAPRADPLTRTPLSDLFQEGGQIPKGATKSWGDRASAQSRRTFGLSREVQREGSAYLLMSPSTPDDGATMTSRRPRFELTRRQALQAGAAGSLAAVAAGRSLAAGASTTFVPLSHPAGPRPNPKKPIGHDLIPKIKKIVVVMMENQSYDAVLGMLTESDGTTPRGDGLTRGGPPGSRAVNSNPAPGGETIESFPMPTTAQMDNLPWQTWDATWTQFLGSPTAQSFPTNPNQGFVLSQSGPVSMAYWTPTQLPFFNSLAGTFPVADRWFCSAPAQTYPNRMFMMAGTSLGLTTTTFPTGNPMPVNGTIFQALSQHGISWKNYHCGGISGASSLIWLGQIGGPRSTPGFLNNLQDISGFFSDCANGTLPSVSLVDPNYGFSSGENAQDLQHADAFMHDVVNAVMAGPSWHETLLLWTFDEHGGYYDHVAPQNLGRPDNSQPSSSGWQGNPSLPSFDYSGMRVPAGVVSPYAKADYVSSTIYDHTSIMKLIESKWNLPSFTSRDKNANNPILDMVDLESTPTFLTPPKLSPKVRDTKGQVVSTGIGGDTRLTADEKKYSDVGALVPGKGYLRRSQFYTTKSGANTSHVTPYYELLENAWATP